MAAAPRTTSAESRPPACPAAGKTGLAPAVAARIAVDDGKATAASTAAVDGPVAATSDRPPGATGALRVGAIGAIDAAADGSRTPAAS
ncbi:MAG: hypothetical protein KF683_21365, partial [Rubrivivax sp.]|nr:hypothetical protein [Rubrivivax sp.]